MEQHFADLEKYGWIGMAVIMFAKEFFSWLAGSTRKYLNALAKNTAAIADLRLEVKALTHEMRRISTLEKEIQDTQRAIKKLRDFQ